MTPGYIIVISRNNLHLTKKAVRSALAQDTDCRILLIDNCSTDGTMQWANSVSASRSHFAAVQWCEQRSLSYCWNMPLRSLFEKGADHVLVCNNDIELRPDTYTKLAHVQVATNSGITSCISVDTSERMDGDRLIGNLIKSARPHPDFSCFMISRHCFETVGPFDEQMWPAYLEDNDYHVRMHRAGIAALCVDLPFLHHGAGTLKYCDPAERSRIERGAAANRERFRQKYGCLPGTKEYGELFK